MVMKTRLSRNLILAKVEKLEREATYIRRCLCVRVCPNCGDENIEVMRGEGWKNGSLAFRCKQCSKFYSQVPS